MAETTIGRHNPKQGSSPNPKWISAATLAAGTVNLLTGRPGYGPDQGVPFRPRQICFPTGGNVSITAPGRSAETITVVAGWQLTMEITHITTNGVSGAMTGGVLVLY